jgi:hypothetical protein
MAGQGMLRRLGPIEHSQADASGSLRGGDDSMISLPGSRLTRREFMHRTSSAALVVGATGLMQLAAQAGAEPRPERSRGFSSITIAGKPRERGRQYGRHYRDDIAAFLDQEIYRAFIEKPSPKEAMLRYAGACAGAIRNYAPIIHDEMEGMAEGSGIRLEELVLITLHEELYHKGVLPKVEHCTAVAVGPPDTGDGNAYVGQTWDWMQSVFGMSSLVRWQRPEPEGPSLLAYAFPGLWVGAGLNSAGLALCWTSADLGKAGQGARVGIPSYVLLAHLLYQDSLDRVFDEAHRATNAGWFTFVMSDAQGNLANVEGSPEGIVTERHRGRLVRIGFGSRQMTRTPDDQAVPTHPRCRKMLDLIAASAGKIDGAVLQGHFQDPECAISVGPSTIDMMVYNCTTREARLSRGPSYEPAWQSFRFDETDHVMP